ncbi:hypothetical protein GALMADRAFT_145847 [Galerina marginata CBS 339.88]|uniref:Phytocyanin domain-containing protein n=1 Tax=Galerina marginata (strain CBS 339.88) TaxID=685588 RepID=A0A067SQS8_GALM3|nr:hypothetical protein GALMADRAFT_145847 [Galerina marginata CBS 339.88]
MISALAILPLALAASFDVQVGPAGALEYSPASLTGVTDGDTINFTFNPKNHTVTQSSFNSPCNPIDAGFTTGFVPVSSGTTAKTFTVPAGTGTKPLWFFCGQTTHCQQGMVFAVNPPQDPSPNSFSAFKALAMGPAGLTSDTSTATAGSHNPTTASGSVFTAASVADGATGSATTGLQFSTTTGAAGGGAAPTTTGKSSAAVASRERVREKALALVAVFFGLASLAV